MNTGTMHTDNKLNIQPGLASAFTSAAVASTSTNRGRRRKILQASVEQQDRARGNSKSLACSATTVSCVLPFTHPRVKSAPVGDALT